MRKLIIGSIEVSSSMSVGILLLIVLAFSASTYAVIDAAVTTALNTVSYTVVTAPIAYANKRCVPICVWTSDASAFTIATDSSGTGSFVIPASSFYQNDCVRIDADGATLYALSSAGTPNLYVSFGRKD